MSSTIESASAGFDEKPEFEEANAEENKRRSCYCGSQESYKSCGCRIGTF